MRRTFISLAIAALVAAPLAALAQQAPSGPIAPMTLKVHDWGPKRAFSYAYEWWAAEVTKRTNGAIKFNLFYSEALGGNREQMDNLKAGVFDVAPLSPGSYPAKTPLYNLIKYPVALSSDPAVIGKAMTDTSELPELKAELERWGVKYLFPALVPSYEYLGSSPFNKVADLKARKIWGTEMPAMIQAMGAVPVGVTAPELFEAMQRKTVEGIFMPIYASGAYKLFETAKYFTYSHVGSGALPVVIRLEVWNKLDPRAQKVMTDVAKEAIDAHAAIYKKIDEEWIAKFKAAGITITELPPAEIAQIKALAQTVWDQSVATQGEAGKKAFSTMIANAKKYQ